jgi:hypothetical protein
MTSLFELPENRLLRFIFGDVSTYINAFSFMESAALGLRHEQWTIECFLNVPRGDLGFDRSQKPGDIDVLLIPSFDGDRFAERSMAVEVKRFVVPRKNRGRGPSEYGTEQAAGLVRDGFPLVGLLHVALVENSSDGDLIELPIRKMRWTEGESEFAGTLLNDPAHSEVMFRHNGRMEKFSMPDCVGTKVQVLQISRDSNDIVGWSVWGWRAPKKNALRCVNLVERLRQLERPPHFRVNRTYPGIEIFSTGGYEYEFADD